MLLPNRLRVARNNGPVLVSFFLVHMGARGVTRQRLATDLVKRKGGVITGKSNQIPLPPAYTARP